MKIKMLQNFKISVTFLLYLYDIILNIIVIRRKTKYEKKKTWKKGNKIKK